MKFRYLLILLVACFLFSSCGKKKLRFVTGGESGTYYAFGSVLAQHASNNTDLKIIGIVGAGSQSNINEIQDKGAEFAFCQSDVMSYAYEGKNLFSEHGAVKNFSTVASLYLEPVQIISVDSNIKSVADLKGKRVSIGSAGSGVYFNAMDVLSAYDLTEKDIQPTYQSFADSVNDLRDGKIDAAFIVAGVPTTAVVDLGATRSVNLVSLDEEHINKLLASSPYYSKIVIPSSVYKTANDVTSVAVSAVIIASDSVSEDDVYKFTKDIFDNPSSLVDAHAKYAELSIEKAVSITNVPYHKGASKYFREKGYITKTK